MTGFSLILALSTLTTTITYPPIPGGVVVPAPAVQSAAQPAVIEQAREQALATIDHLPDFLADQVIHRTLVFQGRTMPRDTLETTIRHAHTGKENIHLVSINGLPTEKTYAETGDVITLGSFSAQMTALFRPSSQGVFTFVGEDLYRDRQCALYSYRVPKETSAFRLRVTDVNSKKYLLPVGYSGRIWIDLETKLVLRVEQAADDILPDFPMTTAEMTVEYGWVRISGERYWMPITGEAVAEFRFLGKTFLNVIEFRNYRKFDADVKMVD